LSDDFKTTLIGKSKDNYGDNYSEHLLRIYHSYVNSADKISNRRQNANSFFLTINTGLIGLIGYLQLLSEESTIQNLDVFIPIAISGIALCILWFRILRSYKQLNSAKFKIIHEIEKYLPLRPYDAEWEAVERGKNPKLYLPFTHIELLIPWIFTCIHSFILACSIPWNTIISFLTRLLN
jgi:hypothetical protein